MYNRILKRPMFRRGGPSFQAQGTGITSPFDTPRRGLVQHPGGYAGKTLEELAVEKEEIFAPKPYQNINDIISSFGVYASPYKDDGTAMTTGEMGALQAEGIKKVRTDRENEQKLAALSNVEAQEAALAKKAEEDAAMARTEKSVWGSMEAAKINANRKMEVDRQQEMIQEAELLYQELLTEYGTADKIPPEKRAQYENLMIVATKGKYMTYAEAVIAANEQVPITDKSLDELGEDGIKAARDLIIYQLTGGLWGKPGGAKGGRVREDRIGLQQSYPGTAGEAQQASFTNTETVTDSPQGITMTDTMTEESPAEDIFSGQTEDPYRLLRARLPQEITDDVVRLIAYNEEAFKDFAEIESQSDVMDFNRKYGVELVLPTDDMA
jgi:hypothetical protein